MRQIITEIIGKRLALDGSHLLQSVGEGLHLCGQGLPSGSDLVDKLSGG